MSKQILSKGISTPIGILIIVLAAIIAGGGILAYQYYWMPEEKYVETPPLVKDETADWKTYRNEEYGFEMKYSENSKVQKENKNSVKIELPSTNYLVVAVEKKDVCNDGPFSQYLEDLDFYRKIGKAVIDGLDFNRLERRSSIMFSTFDYCDFYTTKDTNCYILTFVFRNFSGASVCECVKINKQNEDCDIFNQMLSTFRFLD